MNAEFADGESVLTGDLVDQAQLQGALNLLAGLGVEIISVNQTDQT